MPGVGFSRFDRPGIKFYIVLELCIFHPETKVLILFIYANEFYDAILLFSSLERYRNSNH